MGIDVLTFGEAMVRLSPPNFRRLEQARTLDLFVGGAELNTAVALARLGRSASWVSRLPSNSLGRLIANHAREAGVGTDHVVWAHGERAGLYFVEFGAAPRASSVLYDRKDSAIARIRPGMVDWRLALQGARWFHVTGITPALGPGAAETTREALEAAAAAGLRICIDLNYRAKLWSPDEASRCMTEFMRFCQVLVSTEEDLQRVFGIKAKDYEAAAAETAHRFPELEIVAITIRDNPLVWRNQWTAIAYRAGRILRTRSFEIEIVDRLGAGDSFAAGLMHGLLDDDLQKGLDYGVAASALKHSIPGDFNWVTAEEVEGLLTGSGLRISR
jgi:2-dehydro-3-deoxygluconokinase